MSRVEAAAGIDRLPWLPDEPRSTPERRRSAAASWTAGGAIILVVAGAGFWMGMQTVEQTPLAPSNHSKRVATVRLPQPRPAQPEVRIAPQPVVQIAPAPQIRPAPVRELRIAAGATDRKPSHSALSAREKRTHPSTTEQSLTREAPPVQQPAAPLAVPRPWNPRVVTGAAGRLVQIGAFGSVHQAKRGWWFMVHDYPAMAHLPAVVRDTRNSKGRRFYRFDVGTTSQAHSEVLCQRMVRIHLSCAVVGLPWKARVER